MQGIFTPVSKLRLNLFRSVARMAYLSDDETALKSFEKSGAVKDRLKLALGLSLSDELHFPEKPIEAPLVNVVESMCKACPHNMYFVTDDCRNCYAHPCVLVCPTNAVSIYDGKSHINQDKCIKCGKCRAACPYHAITKREKPCAAACGVDAVEEDEKKRAVINHDKCVACGQCMSACPFAAIYDKSEIYAVIKEIKSGSKVIAAIAPSFVGQFGKGVSADSVFAAIMQLGFYDVYEVAIGADIASFMEAVHFMNSVPDKIPFMATSCCPSWAVMAKRLFPELKGCVLDSSTPMVETGKIIKTRNEDAKVVFIGPCVAKKGEAKREKVKPFVDYVLTFEELQGMFEARNIDFDAEIQEEFENDYATSMGKGYGVCGGVISAISACINDFYGETEIKTDSADGLYNCRKMLQLAKAGKKNGFLLEGMACPGGCVGGAGALIPAVRANAELKKYLIESKNQSLIDVLENIKSAE